MGGSTLQCWPKASLPFPSEGSYSWRPPDTGRAAAFCSHIPYPSLPLNGDLPTPSGEAEGGGQRRTWTWVGGFILLPCQCFSCKYFQGLSWGPRPPLSLPGLQPSSLSTWTMCHSQETSRRPRTGQIQAVSPQSPWLSHLGVWLAFPSPPCTPG